MQEGAGGSRLAMRGTAVLMVGLVPLGLWMRTVVDPPTPLGVDSAESTPEPTPTDPTATLGPLGPPWTPVIGPGWIQDGTVIEHRYSPGLDDPAIATLFVGPDPSVGATFVSPRRGDGLVFRYQDPDNYWTVYADPESGTWRVIKVVDGTSTATGELAVGSIPTLQRVVVASTSGRVVVAIDDRRTDIVDPALSRSETVGLITLVPAVGGSIWTDVRAGSEVGLAGVEVGGG